MLTALGTSGHRNTSHLHVLAARDSTLIMQCHVLNADLSIGGMTKCANFSQPFSRTYAVMLRSSHTFKPWQPRSLTSSANFSDKARLDISAHGFWKRGQRAFFDVRVFNHFSTSHLNQKLDTLSRAMKMTKSDTTTSECQYWSQVEHASFTPLVLSPYGGNSREADYDF